MSTHADAGAERLLGQSHRAGSAEELAATYLRSAAHRRPPGPVALARVRARLDATTASSLAATRLHWKTILAVVALSVGVGGFTGAAMWVAMPILNRARTTPATPAPVPAPKAPRARPRHGHMRAAVSPDSLQTPRLDDEAEVADAPAANLAVEGPPFGSQAWPATAPATVPAPGPGLTSTSASANDVAPPPAPPTATKPRARVSPKLALAAPLPPPATATAAPLQPPTAIAQDAQLLARALWSLRHDHDPLATLVTLDAHAARFPDSALAPEAALTRVDALLALDRRQSALAVLDRLAIPATTRGRELTVVRAELRVSAKRYAEAIADFTRSLDEDGGDALSERALHGRLACYLATANEDRARVDMRDYLSRFPSGRFAPGVRRILGEVARH